MANLMETAVLYGGEYKHKVRKVLLDVLKSHNISTQTFLDIFASAEGLDL